MNSPEIKQFISENSSLFWHIPEKEKENISHEVLVEFILNYGELNTVKKLFDLLGIEKVAHIFYKQTTLPRQNYLKLVKNFFNLYFQRNVPYGNSH